MARRDPRALAVVGDRLLTDLRDVTDDIRALDGRGTWAVVLPFDGPPVCARFERSAPARPWRGRPWVGIDPSTWRSSLDEATFRAGVGEIHRAIADDAAEQVILTRVLGAPLPEGADVAALGAALAIGNPAPFSAVVRLPDHDVHIASASPERFLERDGRTVRSSPIKGTATTAADLLPKDRIECEQITDLVVEEFERIAEAGSVTVPVRIGLEEHPGLVHLVSTVEARLPSDAGWADLLDATFPPASVTGSPKRPALDLIRRLEPVDRGVYCGAVGWVDADRGIGALNVAIRTFWFAEGRIRFGTGAGITAGSDPAGEWAETELKARRLLRVIANRPVGTP